MAAEARKAVIKSGDMADSLQQDAVDSALAVSALLLGVARPG